MSKTNITSTISKTITLIIVMCLTLVACNSVPKSEPLPTQVPAPQLIDLDPSENDTNITATSDVYYETDKFYLLIDEGVTCPSDIATTINVIMDELEELSKLSFYPDSMPTPEDGVAEIKEPWSQIIEDKDKVCIHFKAEENTIRKGETTANCVTIFAPFYNTNEYGLSVIAHELTHLLIFRNAKVNSLVMLEGIAEVYGDKACLAIDGFPICYESYEYGTGIIQESVTAFNSKDLFTSEFTSSPNKKAVYQYGTAFVTFLFETYGEDWLVRYVGAIEINDIHSPEDIALELEDIFEQDVFEKFAAWYQDNFERFRYQDYGDDDIVLALM